MAGFRRAVRIHSDLVCVGRAQRLDLLLLYDRGATRTGREEYKAHDLHKPIPLRRCSSEEGSPPQSLRGSREKWLPCKEPGWRAVQDYDLQLLRGPRGSDEPRGVELDQGHNQRGACQQRDFRVDGLLCRRAPLRRHAVLRFRLEELPRPLRRGVDQGEPRGDQRGRGEDIVFFNRSGYTKSPRYSTLFWVGDQLVDWDEHDGIKSAVTGLLSSGLSGYSLEHSDIGGYTALDNPLLTYHRSKELLLRWIELGAFTTVFRTHEGNIPEVNHQIYSDRETLTQERYGSPQRGVNETVSSPIGEPAVFYKEDSAEGARFREELEGRGLL